MPSSTTHRTWFPFILVGLTIALGAGIWAWTGSDRGPVIELPEIVAPTSLEYQQEITAIIASYYDGDDLDDVYASLLDTWVPADAKSVHLDLVIAFGKLVAGDEEGAELLEAALSTHTWLK
ncbi:hypothetical protein HON52_04980 [Candidatus Uhrbacteria bacterium]|nr:hypothetical protein [Candidatus Uhrbacteria bacterium]